MYFVEGKSNCKDSQEIRILHTTLPMGPAELLAPPGMALDAGDDQASHS
jgi:hypothetical protein